MMSLLKLFFLRFPCVLSHQRGLLTLERRGAFHGFIAPEEALFFPIGEDMLYPAIADIAVRVAQTVGAQQHLCELLACKEIRWVKRTVAHSM